MRDHATDSKRNGSRVSLVDTAYAEIKRRITQNFYPPNHQVLIGDLAAELGMSRTPVRDALIALEKDGLIELTARQGMRILPLTIQDMEDLYDALTCLEVRAAELVAARGFPVEGLQPLADALSRMEQALKVQDLDHWADADEDFHRTMIAMCGNQQIARLANATWDRIRRARYLSLRLVPLPVRSNQEHRKLLDAFLRGEPETARDVHYAQRIRSSEKIVEVLKRFHLSEI